MSGLGRIAVRHRGDLTSATGENQMSVGSSSMEACSFLNSDSSPCPYPPRYGELVITIGIDLHKRSHTTVAIDVNR
jgi:hypothetical protein